MNKKNSVIWVIAGVAALWYFMKKKKSDQLKKPILNTTIMQNAERALSAQLQNVDFIPAKDNDRNLYANDQKLCK